MPELPDLELYLHALGKRILRQPIESFRVASFSLLRTYQPPYQVVEGQVVTSLSRIGKRLVWEFGEELFLVLHLMVAGRLQWKDEPEAPIPKRIGLAAWDFPSGTLILTEQGTKKRAGIWMFTSREEVDAEDRGGLEPMQITKEEFRKALTKENRTIKRALTDPRILSGIGNAYSDEILWQAQISPVSRTRSLTDGDYQHLFRVTIETLHHWTQLLREETGEAWPKKVTAFRPEMAVHGKYGEPCPRCQHPIQRIVYASNETNYCAECQTGGKLLADRSLSRLLKSDWPQTLEELEGV